MRGRKPPLFCSHVLKLFQVGTAAGNVPDVPTVVVRVCAACPSVRLCTGFYSPWYLFTLLTLWLYMGGSAPFPWLFSWL